MARTSRLCHRRLRCNSRSGRRRRRNGRSHRRLGNGRAGRGRNLRGLSGRNRHGFGNCGWRSCRLCLDSDHRRRSRTARLGNNRSGRWDHGWSRRRRRHHCGLQASQSRGRFLRCLICYRFLFGLRFGFRQRAKMLAHLYRGFYLDRAGMRFFLGNAGFGQIVNDGLCLDLKLASQFVDSDLIRIGHCPPGRLLVSVLV
jgi:hypothetical protein